MNSTTSSSPEVRLQSNLSLCSLPGKSGQRNPGLQGLSSHSQGQGDLWYRTSRSYYLWAFLHFRLWWQAGETEPGGGKKFLQVSSRATAYVSFVMCIRTTDWNPGQSEGPFDCTLFIAFHPRCFKVLENLCLASGGYREAGEQTNRTKTRGRMRKHSYRVVG